jgi:prepilin-type N-terminal cleavage/methylation domain-containing protein
VTVPGIQVGVGPPLNGRAIGDLMQLRSKARKGRRGFSLLEVTIAMAVLATAYVGYSKSVVASMQASRSEREGALAAASARQLIAELQASPFDQVWALYNDDGSDDPGGPNTAPGPNVHVPGLNAVDGDPDGMAVQVILPSVDVAGVPQLREDLPNDSLGCPRDLNGDGATDAFDHSGDYQILPVVVRVRWRGTGGAATYELRTSLVNI